MDSLEVPENFPGISVDSDQRISEKIFAFSVGAIEVELGEPKGKNISPRSISMLMNPQTLVPERFFHALPSHVSLPVSPG